MSERFDPGRLAQKAERWVIKVGTSDLTDQEGKVSRQRVQSLACLVVDLWKQGKEGILVTSGAIGIGMGVLGLKNRPTDLAKLQVAAATGQGKLVQWYTSRMEEQGFHAAQVLLTRGDMEDRQRRLNVKATLETLLAARIVPIINENDTVSTEEIRYGDNDLLSAHVATLVGADFLLILTGVGHLIGLDGQPIHRVPKITQQMEQAARDTDKSYSTGGMKTKLEAAKHAMSQGIPLAVMTTSGFAHLIDVLAEKGSMNPELQGTWFIHE